METHDRLDRVRPAPYAPILRAGAGALALVLVAPGCRSDEGGAQALSSAREVELVEGPIRWHAPTAERFGFRAPVERPATPSLSWATPAGWSELEPTTLRSANLLAGGDERAPCFLTLLPGEAGGVLANVNRWREQMALEPLEAGALEVLPRAPFFDGEAVLVDVVGADEQRLVGLVQIGPAGGRFLKLVGPEEVVEAERDAFLELARSFRAGGHAHEHAHAAPPAGESGGGLRWSAPASWIRGAERSMRAVTYQVGTGECYVATLIGDGGGALANANRWRGQMGAEPLDADGFEALPRIPMLGGEALVVEVAGSFSGMGSEDVAEALLLGAIRLLGERAVFVKMIGPKAEIEAQREAFLEFCSSIESDGGGR